jgi:uncharacterized protein GlcG (DUF336 family)
MIHTVKLCAALLAAVSVSVIATAETPAAPSASPTTPTAQTAPPTPPPPAPRARGPSLALAVEAAQVAAATCTANGYKTTVLIVDSAGVPVVLLSGDGAPERTQMIATSKVTIALRYNASSGEVVNRAKTDAALAAELKADPKIGRPFQGALLLKVGAETIGAIAVSGAPGGEKDEVCGQAAVDKIKDRLR